MRIPRFYLPEPLILGQRVELPEAIFRHAIPVLRLTSGETLIFFNGQGGEYQARLTEVGKRHAQVNIEHFSTANPESPLALCLVQALIKPDKMDFALQKAVELGISAFQPLITRRSVVAIGKDKIERKREHWQAIAISACEQSGRTRLPIIFEPISLTEYLATASPTTRLILAPEATERMSTLTPRPPLDIMIGPEGGFAEQELAACLASGCQAVNLGPRILRAETASIAALTLLQHAYGDL